MAILGLSKTRALLLGTLIVGVTGLLYGLAVYLVMNFVVLPLSAAGRGPFSWPVAINGILIHMLGVGLPSSLIAKYTGVRPGPF